jgi:hypothetical protein
MQEITGAKPVRDAIFLGAWLTGNSRPTWLRIRQPQNTASAGFQPDTNLNTIRSLVPGKTVSVALSSSAIFAAN